MSKAKTKGKVVMTTTPALPKIMGIDVDSKYLECCIVVDKHKANASGKRIKNQKESFPGLLKWIKSEGVCQVIMEATGGYEQKVAQYLGKHKISAYIVNPVQARDFARGLGKRAKNDRIDAFVLGRMGQVVDFPPTFQVTPLSLKLKQWIIRRNQLVDMRVEEKNRMRLVEDDIKESIQTHVESLEKEIEAIKEKLEKLIKADERLAGQKRTMKLMKGIGDISSISLLALLPEMGYLNRKQITALAGLAPYDKDSGTREGKRHIWGGRFYARKALYMPALVAIRHNENMRVFYQRLRDNGKEKKVALVAVMRKMLVQLNAMVRVFIQEEMQKLEIPRKVS